VQDAYKQQLFQILIRLFFIFSPLFRAKSDRFDGPGFACATCASYVHTWQVYMSTLRHKPASNVLPDGSILRIDGTGTASRESGTVFLNEIIE
jgi:hypothetical protein